MMIESWRLSLRVAAVVVALLSVWQTSATIRKLDELRPPDSEIAWTDRLWKGWWRNLNLYPDRDAARGLIQRYWLWQAVFVLCGVVALMRW